MLRPSAALLLSLLLQRAAATPTADPPFSPWRSATVNATVRNWVSAAPDATGKRVLASSSEMLGLSLDAGATWSSITLPPLPGLATVPPWWLSVAAADDFSLLLVQALVTAPNGTDTTVLYSSNDEGVTWTGVLSPYLCDWYGQFSMAADGSLAMFACNAPVLLSRDRGASWAVPPGLPFPAAAARMSPDGLNLAALTQGTPSSVYTSNDGGVTWTNSTVLPPVAGRGYLCMGQDGAFLVAGPLRLTNNTSGNFSAFVYTFDGGVSWSTTPVTDTLPENYLMELTCTRDGGVLAATTWPLVFDTFTGGAASPTLFLSTNFGSTWTPASNVNVTWTGEPRFFGNTSTFIGSANEGLFTGTVVETPVEPSTSFESFPLPVAPIRSWGTAATSADGVSVLALAGPNAIKSFLSTLYISRDRGATFTLALTAQLVFGVACDADAGVILALRGVEVDGMTPLLLSKDGGKTWATTGNGTLFEKVFTIAVSSDGNTLAVQGDGVAVSRDRGATWDTALPAFPPPERDFSAFALSRNAAVMAAALELPSGNCSLLVSTDGGNTAAPIQPPPNPPGSSQYPPRYLDLSLSGNGSTLYVLSTYDFRHVYLYATTDGGASWSLLLSNTTQPAIAAMPLSSFDGRVLLMPQQVDVNNSVLLPVVATYDGGATWTPTGVSAVGWYSGTAVSDSGAVGVIAGVGGLWLSLPA